MKEWNLLNIYTVGILLTILMVILFAAPRFIRIKKSSGILVEETAEKKIIACFFILFWGTLAAFRNLNVGTDTSNYSNIFLRIANTNWSQIKYDVEFDKFPLYIIYNKFVSLITRNPNAITVFNSYIIVLGTILFLYYNSKNFGVSVICFLVLQYYFLSMNIARESMAVMFTLWVFHFARRDKWIRSLIFCLIAFFIHRTAILSIAIFFIALIGRTKKSAVTLVLIGSALIVFFIPLASFCIRFFPQYADYLNRDQAFSLFNNSSNGRRKYTAIFLFGIFLLTWLLSGNKKKHTEKLYWQYLTLTLLAIELMIVHSRNDLMARLELYFTYFFMLSLPYAIEEVKDHKSRMILYIGLISVLLVPCLLNLKDYLPYMTSF